MKTIFLSCLLLFVGFTCYSQDQLTVASFLLDANQEEFVSFQRQKLYYFNSLPFDLPIIENLELRTETNEFDWRKQEYVLRVSPNSLKNIKTQKQYQESVKYLTEMELQTAFSGALKERYDLMVDLIYLKKILEVKNKQKVLFNDQVTLLQRSVDLIDFDVLELISVTHDAQENSREILSLKSSIRTVERTIQKMLKSDRPIVLAPNILPGIEDLKAIIVGIDEEVQMMHPELEVRSAQLYNVMLEHEMELSASSFSIGYVQAKYGYNENDPLKKSFSVGIGFDVPLRRSSTRELNELKINILESQSQLRSLANDLDKEAFALLQDLSNQIEKYDLVDSQIEKGQSEFVLQEYRKIAETPPLALLKLRENTLKIELLLQEIQYGIMLSYIAYLDVTGLLSERPLKNYLSKDLTVLEH